MDRVLDSLEASFDASVARAEDEAASDLAVSLLHDARMADVLGHGAWALLGPEGHKSEVVEVGADYLAAGAGDVIVPFPRAIVSAASGAARRPLVSGMTFLERLRAAVRAGASAEVVAGPSTYRGRLARACVDHVAVAPPRGGSPEDEVMIPLAAVEKVRVLAGGQAP